MTKLDTLSVLLRMPRESMIQLALQSTAAVTTEMPVFRVSLVDLPLWLKHLYAEGCHLRQRSDGRVDVTASGIVQGSMVVVATTVDLVRDMELPPVESQESVRLPLDQLGRLELFSAVAS